MITFDRNIKKDVFYLYKAYWSEEPVLYLAGRRFEYRTGSTAEITVYTNREEITLYNNGKLIGTRSGGRVHKFQVPMDGKNELKVCAGDYSDQMVIYKSDTEKPEYKLKKGDSSNWM